MDLSVQHCEVHVTSIDKVRDFYVNKLGLPVIDDMPELKLLALKAGPVRISIFGGYEPKTDGHEHRCGCHMIFRTENLDQTIKELSARGVEFTGQVVEAGGFIRDIATVDPDGNVIEIAEYLRDPLT